MDGATGSGRTPLDDVDHLARSPHRARVMGLFAGDDWTRRDLHEETGIPQPTLGRILGSFGERNWLSRDGDTYSLTVAGRLIAGQFEALLGAVETVQQLPASVDFDPLLDMGFDPEWLARVEVAPPDHADEWYGHLRAARASVGDVDDVREIAPGPMPGMAEVLLERLREGGLRIETVFSRDAFETFVADPANRSLLADVLETDGARVHLVEEDVRCYVARHGERAIFDVPATDGGPITRLATDDPTVRDWVDATVDDATARAEPVTPADLAE